MPKERSGKSLRTEREFAKRMKREQKERQREKVSAGVPLTPRRPRG